MAGVGSEKLLPIGAFARACRLGIKALRHYDDLGLLRPARVDGSGYRYYSRAQARDAIAISLLRSLDVPLPAIKDILASSTTNAMHDALAVERARIERDLARSRMALQCVERIMREGSVMPYEVNVRHEPGRTVLALEARTPPELHVEAGYELFARLKQLTSTLGLRFEGPIACQLPEPPDGDTMILRMTCAAPPDLDPSAVRAHDALLLDLPTGPLAHVTHRGPYEELGLAHHAITAWVEEHGHTTAGSLIEIYENDPTQVAPSALVTIVGIPLAPA